MRQAKKLLALGLVLANTVVPVMANDAVISAPATHNVDVSADITSTWEVTIPKAIVLTSTSSGSGTYTGTIPVKVTGDIGLSEKITVNTALSFKLKDQHANELTASVTKDNKVEFVYADLKNGAEASASHGVEAVLPTGRWAGTLPFEINLSTT